MKAADTEKLGVRKFSDDTRMMAGYYSHFIHSTVYRLLHEKVKPGSWVADIGAGEGAFSERLVMNGYKVISVEGYCVFKVPGAKLYKLNLNESWSDNIEEKVDAVVAIEIMEHMENPFHFLRQIRKIVNEDGYVFISTPNPLEFVARCRIFLKGKVDMMVHPDHRTPIFPDTMERYCAEAGFEIIQRAYDIDTLTVKGTTLRGKIMRRFAKLFRGTLPRDSYTKGNSNIWILKPGEVNIYDPPSHP
jgi:2-polyprenyl-3-methyl-5-hydroxy-6-metoxy-1,4-benzoquinol methylase